jgi:isocitrate dehydrogenase
MKLLIGRYSSATSGDNKIVRDSLHLALVPANQLQVVTQETTCKKANTAFQSFFANTGNNSFSGKVYVVQVGTAYGVVDPSYRSQANDLVGPILFLDSRFKPLSTTM